MSEPRCEKMLHFEASAQEHAKRLATEGYDKAKAYKCRVCPFWHVTKGQRRLLAMAPRRGPDKHLKRRVIKDDAP